MIGKTVSHYKILEKLGEGGMGVVYKAEDTKLKRIVALKFLSPQIVGGEEEKKRFVHEAQAAAALHHPNICTIHEIDEADGHTFIAMAYLDGESIREKIAAKPLKLDEAVEIAMQVAQGLQEAHDKDVVHRDIKSSNVMVTIKGQAILMDFGLARQAGRTVLTKEGTTLGTIAYMSPEQAQGAHVDHRTDIWSFGVMLYEMVTGQNPFAGDYEQAVVYSILLEDPEPITGLRTGVPMELERLVNKALAKDPAERYQNVNDMLIDLRSVAKVIESGATHRGERPLTPGTTELERAASGSFLKNLLARRIPQILGLYFAASWGIIQFVEWLLSRYPVSPHLPDFSFVILVSLIPTVYLLAYFHGRPGPDRWTQFEKIGIPLNLLASGALLFFVFQGKDLGAATTSVFFTDEDGNTVERVIPKNQFRRKMVLFYFDNETGDSELDWLQYGFISMLEFDFTQELFMDIRTGYSSSLGMDYYVYEKMKKAGFEKGVELPLTLKRKIADDLHLKNFASGSFAKKDDAFAITVALYETKNSKLISKNSFNGTDVFQLADEISLKLKQDLELPKKHLDEVNDLPVSEILTNSIPAMKAYSAGQNAIVFDQDWTAAQTHYEQAVKEDPSFAMGYVMLKLVYLFTNQNQKRAEVFGPLMQHLYKLPERFQLFVKSDYYFLKQDPEKQLSVIKMLVSLYPEDVLSRSILALFYQLRNRKDEALAEYKRILEIDPEQDEVVRAVGRFHKQRGEFGEALKYFKQYSEKFPNDIKSYQNIGGVYLTLGDYEQAKTYYEKVLLFEPENISTLATLASIEALTGNFEQSLTQIQYALTLCKTAKDKFKVYKSIEAYYEMRGQINKSLEYMHLKLTELDKFAPPLLALSEKMDALEKYVVAGQKETAFVKVRELEAQLSPPFNESIPFGYLQIYIELGDAEKAEEAIAGADAYIKKFQFEINRPIVLNGQGRVHEIRGEFEQAIQSYQKQLELEPTKAKIHRNIGRCYRQLKDYKKAEKHLQKTLQRYPFNAKTLYELALVYSENGETEKTLEHLQKAVKVWENADADHKYATQAKKKLSALQS